MTCNSKFETKSPRVFVGIGALGHEILIKSTNFVGFAFAAFDKGTFANIKTKTIAV
jgi:hypothetical protein